VNLDLQAWRQLWGRFSLQPKADHWFEEISRRYNEPHRHYHNVQHIHECLREFQHVRKTAPIARELELALWMHDVIYDPHRSDNEEESIRFSIELLNDAWTDELFSQRVTGLIGATKHDRLPDDKPSQLIIDIDLSILGQPAERFWQYEAQIRQEYAFVPEDTFNEKRAEILEHFLARPRIFQTPLFLDRYESQARANLSASISRLRYGAP
jgi:predicted metal-dependent HD superfamily phosphohydrolase